MTSLVQSAILPKVTERAEIEELKPEVALMFFKRKVYPSAVRDFQVEQATEIEPNFPASGEPLLVDLLVRCIEVYKVPVKQVQ